MTTAISCTSEITVKYIQHMGSDQMLAAAAWASSSAEEGLRRAMEKPIDVKKGINYLVKHRHGTPFEHSALTAVVHAPLKVYREWHRHRAGWSYNEESGRYKQLEPVFYLPRRDRPMVKIAEEKWTPARPKFSRCDDDAVFNRLCRNQIEVYQLAYDKYVDNLSMNLDPGLCRDCLPVGIFSTCWMTCNPRSLMHFLSLRVHDPEAKFVSYPLWEIDYAARICETLLKKFWPITHTAFVANGRVAP